MRIPRARPCRRVMEHEIDFAGSSKSLEYVKLKSQGLSGAPSLPTRKAIFPQEQKETKISRPQSCEWCQEQQRLSRRSRRHRREEYSESKAGINSRTSAMGGAASSVPASPSSSFVQRGDDSGDGKGTDVSAPQENVAAKSSTSSSR